MVIFGSNPNGAQRVMAVDFPNTTPVEQLPVLGRQLTTMALKLARKNNMSSTWNVLPQDPNQHECVLPNDFVQDNAELKDVRTLPINTIITCPECGTRWRLGDIRDLTRTRRGVTHNTYMTWVSLLDSKSVGVARVDVTQDE